MPERQLTIDEVLSLLAETPIRLAEPTEALEPEELRAAPKHDEWSLNDVLGHLRCCADVWGSYIARILTEDRPAIRAVSPRTWIKRTDYPELDFRPSLHAFTAQRADLLAVLKPLPPEDWSRTAEVTSVGRTVERTVLNYAERLARHERSHYKQVDSIVDEIHDARLARVSAERKL